MKLVYRGGYNKLSQESIKKSFWYDYKDLIKDGISAGRKVAIVTLAKPDNYFNKFIAELPEGIDTIDTKFLNPKWYEYDLIFIPGGDTLDLFKGLKSRGFNLSELKNGVVVVGDSAGAYVLSSYFYNSPPGEDRGKVLEFYKGLNPDANLITVAHVNNPVYCNNLLLEEVKKFANKKGLRILMLEENQEENLEIVRNLSM